MPDMSQRPWWSPGAGDPVSRTERAAQLVDALMKVPVLDTLRSRRLCVETALERLGQRLSVAEFDEKKPHLVEMVKVFGGVPEGWRELTGAVRFLAHYDLPSEQAAALAVGPAPHLGDSEQRRELASLLAGLDRQNVPELERIFAFAAGDGFGPLPASVRTAWEAYELLENCNVPPDGVSRSVRFVQEVAYVVGPELGDALRQWLSRDVRASVDEGVEAMRLLDNVRRSTGRWREAAEGTAYVVVRLHPCEDSAEHVWLTCWTSTGGSWEPRQRDDRRLPLSDVPARVAALVDQEEARLRHHRGGVVLEFILPVDMVNTPVEEWPRAAPFGSAAQDAAFAAPFGMEYKVVIRSLERMDALHLHRVWNERWQVLTGGGAASVHRCEKGDGSQRQHLYAKLKQDPSIALMTLGSPPDDEAGRRELVLGLQVGLPVLLWAHEGALSDREHAVVHTLSDAGGWDALLDHVTRLHFSPGTRDDGREDAMRSRIAVLWDDPSRLPEVPESAG